MTLSTRSVLIDEANVADALGQLAQRLRVDAAMSDSVGDGEVLITLRMSSGEARKLAGGVDQLRRRAAAHDSMAEQLDDVLSFRDVHARIDAEERREMYILILFALILSFLMLMVVRVFQ